jgi:hypothetical protein
MVVVGHVGTQEPAQMSGIENEDLIQALAARSRGTRRARGPGGGPPVSRPSPAPAQEAIPLLADVAGANSIRAGADAWREPDVAGEMLATRKALDIAEFQHQAVLADGGGNGSRCARSFGTGRGKHRDLRHAFVKIHAHMASLRLVVRLGGRRDVLGARRDRPGARLHPLEASDVPALPSWMRNPSAFNTMSAMVPVPPVLVKNSIYLCCLNLRWSLNFLACAFYLTSHFT